MAERVVHEHQIKEAAMVHFGRSSTVVQVQSVAEADYHGYMIRHGAYRLLTLSLVTLDLPARQTGPGSRLEVDDSDSRLWGMIRLPKPASRV